MSDRMYEPIEPAGPESTRDVVSQEASGVVADTKESTVRVASTAKDEALRVAEEAKTQAQELIQQIRDEAGELTTTQQRRAAEQLHNLADQLASMASSAEQPGAVKDLTQQAADRVHAAAGWLEQREPRDILEEIRRYSRSKPTTFMAATAAVGFIGGRMTRGIAADRASKSQPDPMASVPETTTMYPPTSVAPLTEPSSLDQAPPVVSTGTTTYTTGSGVGIPESERLPEVDELNDPERRTGYDRMPDPDRPVDADQLTDYDRMDDPNRLSEPEYDEPLFGTTQPERRDDLP